MTLKVLTVQSDFCVSQWLIQVWGECVCVWVCVVGRREGLGWEMRKKNIYVFLRFSFLGIVLEARNFNSAFQCTFEHLCIERKISEWKCSAKNKDHYYELCWNKSLRMKRYHLFLHFIPVHSSYSSELILWPNNAIWNHCEWIWLFFLTTTIWFRGLPLRICSS